MADTIESLLKEKEALNKKVEDLEKGEKAFQGLMKNKDLELGKERTNFQNEIAAFKKKRIWGISIAAFVFITTAVIMFFLGWVVVSKPMNAEQSVVLSVIVLGWYALVVAFCRIFGRNDDTWQ